MKAGIIGYGLMGKRRAAALDSQPVIADVGDPIGPSCDCDATIISVPTPNLHDVCVDAMKAGARRILLEKPCGTVAAHARNIASLADHYGAVVVPGYTLRHYPGVRALKEPHDFGRLLWGSMKYGHGGGATAWRASGPGSGELLDQGSHLLDIAEWIVPGALIRSANLSEWNGDVEDHVNISIGRFDLAASWVQWNPMFYINLTFEQGDVEVAGLGGPYGEHAVRWRHKDGVVTELRQYGDARQLALRNEWSAFLKETDNSRMKDAIRTLELIEEVRACAS